ncbi:MAG: 6-phosphofructokinase [Acidobacteria bacterium]|nr:MAG: 6-phosphofructokinase [Acidobacteriota bacterium]
MNAAVRAIVRTALDCGLEVYGIHEGYAGLIEGGDRIRPLGWNSVGGIMHRGGTIIGTARSEAFKTREGRLAAARNILHTGIDSLIVVGGDGSLFGADLLRREWAGLLEDLVAAGSITRERASSHPRLLVVGLFGSIDNDAFGTDMTIGADTALHRITEAIDAIGSTASSHRRTFIVEVMGRHCGYLALMGALATGADWVLVPEHPPESETWEADMIAALKAGREAGRRDAIVVVAEGATDSRGQRITSERLRGVLEAGLNESVRITVLGHVQRGGSPSAFDRNLGTIMGHAAVETLLSGGADQESQVIGMQGNRVARIPLAESVLKSREINELLEAHQYSRALELRGKSFTISLNTLKTLLRALPHPPRRGQRRLRLAVLNAGAPAPGMNAAVRAAVRIAIDQGHVVFGVRRGFQGLAEDDMQEMAWMSVNGWAPLGGSELGTNRVVPNGPDLYSVAKTLEKRGIEGILVIGGWEGYMGAYRLFEERVNFPAFDIPIVCLPATIDNNLPGTELSIGADTALNNIVTVVDKIKQSAVAERRCYIVEVMGRRCGYLALMSGLATGAERVYLHEEGVTLKSMKEDLDMLIGGFREGKRLGLIIRNENANPTYSTSFMSSLFEEESGGAFAVRESILGHLQQGGDPSPFDRIQATRLARRCVGYLIEQAAGERPVGAFIGMEAGHTQFHPLEDMPRMMDVPNRRPKQQWWLGLRTINNALARSGPTSLGDEDDGTDV